MLLLQYEINSLSLSFQNLIDSSRGVPNNQHTVKLLINAPGVYSNNRQIPPAFSGVPACESSSSKSWVELSWVKSWIDMSISTFVTFIRRRLMETRRLLEVLRYPTTVSRKSVHNFLSNFVDRQTDRQTNQLKTLTTLFSAQTSD